MSKYREWLEPWRPARGCKSKLFQSVSTPAVQPAALKGFTKPQLEFLRRRVSLDAPDLRVITREELPTYFSLGSELNESRFVLTFVFQYFVRFQAGQDQPIRGNIRSFWYRLLSRNLERLGLLDPPGGLSVGTTGQRGRYLLKTMENSFEILFKHEFFHYRDLEIYNHRERFRRMGRGPGRRHLLYLEKEGLFWFCEEMHSRHAINVYASRGSASWLDVDYLAQALTNLGVKKLIVAAFTDYDPWGVFIAQQIKKKLEIKFLGFKVQLHLLTQLSLFDPGVVELNKRYLLKGHEDQGDPIHQVVMSWVEQGGGIDGKPYGIHIDHVNWRLAEARVEKWLKGKLESNEIHLELPEKLRRQLERRMGTELL